MFLSEATETDLLNALRDKMPKTLYGHPVERVTFSLCSKEPTQNFSFHLRTKSGNPVCGSTLNAKDTASAARDAHFCVFEKDAPSQSAEIVAFGAGDMLQEERFQ